MVENIFVWSVFLFVWYRVGAFKVCVRYNKTQTFQIGPVWSVLCLARYGRTQGNCHVQDFSVDLYNHLVVKTLVLVLAGNVEALLLVVTILLLRTLSRLAPDRESLSPSSTSLTLLTSPRTPGLMMLVVRTLPGLLAGMGSWGREAVRPMRRRDGASDDNILIKKIEHQNITNNSGDEGPELCCLLCPKKNVSISSSTLIFIVLSDSDS